MGLRERPCRHTYPGGMRPVAVYSALRLGLFLATLLILRALGVGGVLSLVIALVVAMLLSFIVLRRQRDAVTLALMERRRGTGGAGQAGTDRAARRPRRTFSHWLADDAAVEDAALDARDTTRPGDGTAGGTR